jgi:GNAT superfamily N-acetyltransferase
MTKKGGELAKKIDAHAKGRVADALVLLKPEEKNTVLQGMSLYAQALRKARLKQEVIIGEIIPQESSIITKITLDVLTEYGCNRPGFASHDEKLHDFYAVYQEPRSKYFVAHLGDKVVGGAGIAPLEGGDDKTCELQRMYILKEARGLGLGAMLINKCLEAAKKFGFSLCYLETTESMKEAQELYRKHGFTECKKRLGDTGHFGCEKLYEKKL